MFCHVLPFGFTGTLIAEEAFSDAALTVDLLTSELGICGAEAASVAVASACGVEALAAGITIVGVLLATPTVFPILGGGFASSCSALDLASSNKALACFKAATRWP